MGNLTSYLIQHIQHMGPIDMGQFMSACLGHPKYGYYMRGDPFGSAGDFITAPEVSQMFGEMVGLCLAEYWMQIGCPEDFILLECGPGRGSLIADILQATRGIKGFHAALHLHLLEMSPVLRRRQAAAVSPFHLLHEVVFCNGLGDVSDALPVLVVGNEFLDALPVRQFEKYDGRWMERVVGVCEDARALVYGISQPGLDPDLVIPNIVGEAQDGAIFEFSPARLEFTRQICDMLRERGGAALFLDYGETRSQLGNSIHAILDHQHVDVLSHAGESDVSAHVDFAAIAREVDATALDVYGVVEQGVFLQNLGIFARAEALSRNASVQQQDIEKALHRLTDSDQMGSLFKVIGFGYGSRARFSGF